MAKDTNPFEDLSAIAKQTMEQTRGAMVSYFDFLEKSISASPWGGTDLSKKLKSYAEKNIATALGFAEKLSHAKDFQDLVRIQTEFVQTQSKSLGEQAKELGEISAKAAADAIEKPFNPSS